MEENARATFVERDEARNNNRGGFAFLLVAGVLWLVSGFLSLILATNSAALVFLFQGFLVLPLSLSIEKLLGYAPLTRENSLFSLYIQVALVQGLAIPAVVIVYSLEPLYVPAAMAAIVGGHFLPYIWLQRSKLYGAMGGIVSLVPYALILTFGESSFYAVGFVVGASLLVFAFVIRAQIEGELATLHADR